jgi:predicted DNA-binding transcriptional regulator AlpA
MSIIDKNKFNKEIYKEIADLYIINKLSLSQACAKVGMSQRNYYKICKKLDVPSVHSIKHRRLDYIDNENADSIVIENEDNIDNK